jgi:transposase
VPVDLPVPQEPKAKKTHTAKREHPGRVPIPEHLERLEIVLDIPEEDKVCQDTGKPLNMIGWEVSEKLCTIGQRGNPKHGLRVLRGLRGATLASDLD